MLSRAHDWAEPLFPPSSRVCPYTARRFVLRSFVRSLHPNVARHPPQLIRGFGKFSGRALSIPANRYDPERFSAPGFAVTPTFVLQLASTAAIAHAPREADFTIPLQRECCRSHDESYHSLRCADPRCPFEYKTPPSKSSTQSTALSASRAPNLNER